MKRLIALLTVLCLLPCAFAAAEEGAEPGVLQSGDYEYILLEDGTAEIRQYTGKDENITIPDQLDGAAVTSIGEAAFSLCAFLSSVTIPDSVTRIGDWAFDCCEALTSITIPDSVTRIGANPFAECDDLTEIYVSSEHPYLSVIDGVLFSKPDKRLVCYPCSLRNDSYTIPAGINMIGAHAFFWNQSLTSVTIPDSVTSIEDDAFASCTSLTSVTIPDSVARIGRNPFADCMNLTEIHVSPEHPYLAVIDGVLFSKPDMRLVCHPCSSRSSSYDIPAGIKMIGDYAFDACEALTSVTIPDSGYRPDLQNCLH